MKIYVAAASSEIDRAEGVIAELRKHEAIEVVSTWTEQIRKLQREGLADAANPMSKPIAERWKYARQDLEEVSKADVFWLLLPERPTIGAWVELGSAITMELGRQYTAQIHPDLSTRSEAASNQLHLICSGKEAPTVFTAACHHFATDDHALHAIVGMIGSLNSEVSEVS